MIRIFLTTKDRDRAIAASPSKLKQVWESGHVVGVYRFGASKPDFPEIPRTCVSLISNMAPLYRNHDRYYTVMKYALYCDPQSNNNTGATEVSEYDMDFADLYSEDFEEEMVGFIDDFPDLL